MASVQYGDGPLQVEAEERGVHWKNICCICLKTIETQIYKMTGVCSENCRKDRDDDHAPFRGGALAP